jgi:hypothetical protein
MGVGAGTAQAAPTSPLTHQGRGAGAIEALGAFVANVDLASISLRDVRGNKCELTVNGTLTFSGTLAGAANGTTTAVIFAPCTEVALTPPGTFFDVFRFEGTFDGTVDGSTASGSLTYAGITRPGGAIDAQITLRGNATAVLRADAVVLRGGTYTGIVKT